MSGLRMFLWIVRVRSTEKSGIKGGKISFAPNIITCEKIIAGRRNVSVGSLAFLEEYER